MSPTPTRWSLVALAALALGVLTLGGCVYHHGHGGGHRDHGYHRHHHHGGHHRGHHGHHR